MEKQNFNFRVAVDASKMFEKSRGMAKFSQMLIKPIEGKVLGLIPRGYPRPPFRFFEQGISFYPIWEQFSLPKICSKLKVKFLLCPYNSAPILAPKTTKTIVVVHDLIFLESIFACPPSISLLQNLGRFYWRIIVPKIISKANFLITVSNFTKKKIVEKFLIDENSINVIPNGLSDDWFVDSPLPLNQRKPYLLSVTGEAPSKNLDSLILAFGKIKKFNVSLCIVGVKDQYHKYFQKIAEKAGVGSKVFFESYVSEDRLRKLYREALLFVFPSLYEGFGIPLIEAMASGTPVICSNTTSIPEIVGEAALLFNPRNIEDISAQLEYALTDKKFLFEKSLKGLEQAQKFNYSNIYDCIVKFWKKIAL